MTSDDYYDWDSDLDNRTGKHDIARFYIGTQDNDSMYGVLSMTGDYSDASHDDYIIWGAMCVELYYQLQGLFAGMPNTAPPGTYNSAADDFTRRFLANQQMDHTSKYTNTSYETDRGLRTVRRPVLTDYNFVINLDQDYDFHDEDSDHMFTLSRKSDLMLG